MTCFVVNARINRFCDIWFLKSLSQRKYVGCKHDTYSKQIRLIYLSSFRICKHWNWSFVFVRLHHREELIDPKKERKYLFIHRFPWREIVLGWISIDRLWWLSNKFLIWFNSSRFVSRIDCAINDWQSFSCSYDEIWPVW